MSYMVLKHSSGTTCFSPKYHQCICAVCGFWCKLCLKLQFLSLLQCQKRHWVSFLHQEDLPSVLHHAKFVTCDFSGSTHTWDPVTEWHWNVSENNAVKRNQVLIWRPTKFASGVHWKQQKKLMFASDCFFLQGLHFFPLDYVLKQ